MGRLLAKLSSGLLSPLPAHCLCRLQSAVHSHIPDFSWGLLLWRKFGIFVVGRCSILDPLLLPVSEKLLNMADGMWLVNDGHSSCQGLLWS